MKKIFVILNLLFLFSGCQDQQMPFQEYSNAYAHKTLLILSKASDFKSRIIETVVKRLRYSYSIIIDDLAKIDKYNFAAYDRVLLIESKQGGRYEQVEKYLSTYGGVNNMVMLGTVGGWADTPNIRVDAITSASSSENIAAKANILVRKIRQF